MHWCRPGLHNRGIVVVLVVVISVIGAGGDSVRPVGGVRECDLSGGGRPPATERRPGSERGAGRRVARRVVVPHKGGDA